MHDTEELPAEATPDVFRERRRPGRPATVSPELVPLLRNAASVEIPEQDAYLDAPRDLRRDDMAPARGLAVALLSRKNSRCTTVLLLLCLTVLLSTVSVAQSDGKFDAYKRAVADQMRDPSSVQFRNLHVVRRPKPQWPVMCGEFNAKNGFGGYSGFQRFFAYIADGPKGVGAVVNTGNMADRLIVESSETARVCR